jgi:DNA-binding XRE family transcriptional regulator
MASTRTGDGRHDARAKRLLGGERGFVILPAAEYRRLVRLAGEPRLDAVAYARQSIGRDLVRRRRDAGLSQRNVASRAGLRVETLSRLENGRGNPTLKTVQAILRALPTRLPA